MKYEKFVLNIFFLIPLITNDSRAPHSLFVSLLTWSNSKLRDRPIVANLPHQSSQLATPLQSSNCTSPISNLPHHQFPPIITLTIQDSWVLLLCWRGIFYSLGKYWFLVVI